MLVFNTVLYSPNLLAMSRYRLLQKLYFEGDVVFEFFILELVVVTKVPNLFESVINLFHVLIKNFKLRPVRIRNLLNLLLQVLVDFNFECFQVHLADLFCQKRARLLHCCRLNLECSRLKLCSEWRERVVVHALLLFDLTPECIELKIESVVGNSFVQPPLHVYALLLQADVGSKNLFLARKNFVFEQVEFCM